MRAHPIATTRSSRRDAARTHTSLDGSVLSQHSRTPSATATPFRSTASRRAAGNGETMVHGYADPS